MKLLFKEALLERIETIKATRNSGDTALLQFKTSLETRTKLIAKLKKDNLTQKDLFQAAIDTYLKL